MGPLRSLLLALLLLPPAARGEEAAVLRPVPARPAPPLAQRIGGADALAPHAGKPVVVNFWATWCEPCREEMPALDQLRARRPDVAVLTVAVSDSAAKVRQFTENYLLDLPVILDPDQAQSRPWDVRVLPTTVVLDARHRVRYRAVGALDWYDGTLDRLLDRLKSP